MGLAARVGAVLVGSHLGWAFLSSAAIAVALYFWRRGREPVGALWAMRLWSVVACGSLLLLATLADLGYRFGSPVTYARFWAPAIIASVLIPLVAINTGRAAARGPIRLWSAAALGAVVIATDFAPVAAGQAVITVAADTVTGRLVQQLSGDRYALERPDYAQASALIPRGCKVLAAVDYPSLLLEAGLDVHTLDIAGSTSPLPHLPYFTGSAQKLRWLRANGYDYVIAEDPAASTALYNRTHWQANRRSGDQFGGWAPDFLDWFDFVHDLSNSAHSLPAAGLPLIVLKV